ncbi:MAG: diphthine--ammonia ligase, partial [Nitrososphaerales archaeon]
AYCTLYQAECLGMPLISTRSRCTGKDEELEALEQAIMEAKQTFAIEGIVTGGLASKFQQENFQQVCNKLGLQYYSPNWGIDQLQYMNDLLTNDFVIMIVGVSAYGLDEKWLGKILDSTTLAELHHRSSKYGFNIAFEGGEAETFVLDCPIFKKRIVIKEAKEHWDGARGYFEILDITLVNKER